MSFGSGSPQHDIGERTGGASPEPASSLHPAAPAAPAAPHPFAMLGFAPGFAPPCATCQCRRRGATREWAPGGGGGGGCTEDGEGTRPRDGCAAAHVGAGVLSVGWVCSPTSSSQSVECASSPSQSPHAHGQGRQGADVNLSFLEPGPCPPPAHLHACPLPVLICLPTVLPCPAEDPLYDKQVEQALHSSPSAAEGVQQPTEVRAGSGGETDAVS